MNLTMGKKSKGQSTAEYAVVIAIVLGAVVGMQTYVKRGLQAKLQKVTDTMTANTASSVVDANNIVSTLPTTKQYEPYYATRTNMQTDNVADGAVAETVLGNATGFEVTSRSGMIRSIRRSGEQAEQGSATSQNQGWQ